MNPGWVGAGFLVFVAAVPLLPVSAAVFFSSDFEGEDKTCWDRLNPPGGPRRAFVDGCVSGNGQAWNRIIQSNSANTVDLTEGERSHSGLRSMRIVYRQNEGGDTGAIFITTDPVQFPQGLKHIFIRYYDYYSKDGNGSEEDFDFAQGMKVGRISSFDFAAGLNNADIILSSQKVAGSNCGLSDMSALNIVYNGNAARGAPDWGIVGDSAPFSRGRWYAVEAEVKLNTPGVNDAAVRLWVDGRLLEERPDPAITYRTPFSITASNDWRINRVMFGGWYSNGGGGTCPEPDTVSTRYIDDVAISTSYIGVIPSVAVGPGEGEASVSFVTPRRGTTRVEYGETAGYGSFTTLDPALVTDHAQVVRGLLPNRTYHFRVHSTWDDGYQYVSPDHTFATGAGSGGPGLVRECDASRPEWIFCDDFESDRSASYYERNTAGGEFSRTSGVGVESSQGMRVIYRPGRDESGNFHLSIGRNPVTANSRRGTEDFRDIYYRMFIRLQPGWQGNPYKLSRATVFSSADRSQAMFAHVWQGSGNTLAVDPARCVGTDNQVDCVGYNDFAHMTWLGARSGATPIFDTANADQWQCVEHHVRLNDPGMSNGVSEFWMNDRYEAGRTDLDFVRGYTAYGLNAVFFENYWNGGASPQTQERYFDNIVVSTERIGCGGSPVVPEIPRPRRLRVR